MRGIFRDFRAAQWNRDVLFDVRYASLEGKVRRAIDIHEGEEVEEAAFKTLVREAVALNRRKK